MDKIPQLITAVQAAGSADDFKTSYTNFKRQVLLPEGILALSPVALNDPAILNKVVEVAKCLEVYAFAAIKFHQIEAFMSIYAILHNFYIDFDFFGKKYTTQQSYHIIAYYLLSLLLQDIVTKEQQQQQGQNNNNTNNKTKEELVVVKKKQTFQTMILYIAPHDELMATPAIKTTLALQQAYTSGAYNKTLKLLHTDLAMFQAAGVGFDFLLNELEQTIVNRIASLLAHSANTKYKLSTVMTNYSLTQQNVEYLQQNYGWQVNTAADAVVIAKVDKKTQDNAMSDGAEVQDNNTDGNVGYSNKQFIADLIKIARQTERIV
eukprot:UN04822